MTDNAVGMGNMNFAYTKLLLPLHTPSDVNLNIPLKKGTVYLMYFSLLCYYNIWLRDKFPFLVVPSQCNLWCPFTLLG